MITRLQFISVDLCYMPLPTSTAVLTVGHHISVTSSNSLTDSDLQPLTETEQDQMWHSVIQYNYPRTFLRLSTDLLTGAILFFKVFITWELKLKCDISMIDFVENVNFIKWRKLCNRPCEEFFANIFSQCSNKNYNSLTSRKEYLSFFLFIHVFSCFSFLPLPNG